MIWNPNTFSHFQIYNLRAVDYYNNTFEYYPISQDDIDINPDIIQYPEF